MSISVPSLIATSVQAMNLVEYQTLLRGQTLPSSHQIRDFVDYVSGKHSWYKHLPLTPPGVRFCFFLDPSAGMQRCTDAQGRVSMRDITEDDTQFHYASMPTARYRERFACLGVRDTGGPSIELLSAEGVQHHDVPPGIWTGTEFSSIPSEVQFLGSVAVTAMIHSQSSASWVWERYLDAHENLFGRNPAKLSWPEESGGVAVLDAIRERLSSELLSRSGLNELIAPERERQHESMRQCAQWVVDFVAGNAQI